MAAPLYLSFACGLPNQQLQAEDLTFDTGMITATLVSLHTLTAMHLNVQELAAVRKARKEERDVQSSMFKGRLFPPGPPPADPQVDWAADVQKPLLVRLWAHLRALLRLLFPAAIWQRNHGPARTEVPS